MRGSAAAAAAAAARVSFHCVIVRFDYEPLVRLTVWKLKKGETLMQMRNSVITHRHRLGLAARHFSFSSSARIQQSCKSFDKRKGSFRLRVGATM
ncbi:hypothetical protein F2P81_008453 [Scophthalmus maximus]|uniref:Uncharacterized protein n=1 Tax=Scophthalmus maximus TaxID=52904 RepID=A0A6A4T7B1_SCOMX|nr:hypothetical protein F2P81_008453 [Scophthalmus maximus]